MLVSWHHLCIFSYYHSPNGISSLANYMAKLLREWKPIFAVALVVRGLLIVTSETSCDVTSGPFVMRRYANADGDEQRYKTSKTQVSLAFCKIVIVVPAQRVLCRIAVPTTPAQTVSWPIPISFWAIRARHLPSHVFEHWLWRYRYFWSKVNIWYVKCARATAFIFDTLTGVLVKVSKFLIQKMSRPKGDSNPQTIYI